MSAERSRAFSIEPPRLMHVTEGITRMASAAEKISTISIAKLHPPIGAEIGGVDLRYPLDDETIGQIKDAWHRHTVLVFRGQDLSEADQRRFASYFGPVAKRVQPPASAGRAAQPEADG